MYNIAWLQREKAKPCGPGILVVQKGEPPFGEPAERLPFGHTVIDSTRPEIIRWDNVNGVERWAGKRIAWLGTEPAQLIVYAPKDVAAVLSFAVAPGPSRPGTARRTLRLTDACGRTHEVTVEAEEGTTVRFPVTLPAGVSRMELGCTDRPTATHPSEPRVMIVAITAMKLEPAGPGAVGCVREEP